MCCCILNWVWALSCGSYSAGQIYDGGKRGHPFETARNEASEELRVLYVAMTRGKGKTDSRRLRFRAAARSAQACCSGDGTGNLSPYAVRSVRNAGHWLMLCALNHPDGAVLRQMAGAEETPVCREG